MTQFLLTTKLDQALPPGFVAKPIKPDESLHSIAGALFPNADVVVRVAPAGTELDPVVDDSREQVLAGEVLQATSLGKLLVHLVGNSSQFVLFWGNDVTDLPVASSLPELWQLLKPQLCTPQGNWEIYVRYSSAVAHPAV